jgi:hypothetical protein
MSSADQFLSTVALPPDLTSAAYASAVNEVQSLGSSSSTSRTADQTQIAQFWSDASGTSTEAGQWNQIASQVAQKQGDSLADDARLFGELNTGLADAGIAGWNAKYSVDFWSPVTAIQNFTPLVTTPESPEYVETQSTFSAAAADILGNFFGQNVGFTATSAALPGVTRTYSSFAQAAQEAGRSGIFAGNDFQFSNVAGQNLGQNVGDLVLQGFDISKDAQPPRVLFDQPTKGIVTNTDPIITGHVLENLAGVATLQVKLDDGSFVAVSFDQTGKFSVPVNLALDGSADGQHALTFIATDALGKATSPLTVTFTLATKAPRLSFTNGLADGAVLAAGSGMAGTVTTSAGVALAGLTYAFDNGTSVPVAFNPADKSFSQAFDLSQLAAGAHRLTVTGTDAAGNVTVQTLNVLLPQLIPLAVTAVEPAANAGDVSVTFRPLVTFSRAVDPSTLNSNDFFLTDSAGNKIAATIVPWADNMHAWLFPADPLPGAQSITLHIDGSQIKDAADGVALDAAGSGQAGSVLTQSFTTVDTTPVANTTISGQIVDPGNRPIAGVTVYVLGHEDQQVVTDATGHFILTSVPAGNVKVETDGRTATNAPPGTFFPLLTVSLTVRPGQDNTIAGSRGPIDLQVDNTANQQLVLPPVKADTLTTLSQTAPTVLHTTADSSATLTPQQLQQVSLTVQPNTLIDETGKPMPASSQVGISVISSDTVRDMLQPGVPRNSLVVTVSASGLASFTAPAVLTVPNVFGLPPGTKTSFLTFDYATGVTTIAGTCTVSADGKTIKTDPGTGITKPGWFTITPPGTPAQNKPMPRCDLGAVLSDSAITVVKDALKAVKAAGAELGNVVSLIPAAISVVTDGVDIYHRAQDFITKKNVGQFDAASVATIAKDIGDTIGTVSGELIKTGETLDAPVKAVLTALKVAQPLVDAAKELLKNMQDSNCVPHNLFWDGLEFLLEEANSALKFVNDKTESIEKGIVTTVAKLATELTGVILTDVLKPPALVASQTASPFAGSPLTASLTAGVTAAATASTTSSPSLDAIAFGLSTLADLQTAMSQLPTGVSQIPPVDQIGSAIDNVYQAVVGTPPNAPYAFFLPDGNVIRGHSDASGAIQVFLPPSTSYQFGILDPRYNMFAFASGTSAPSGATTELPTPLHYRSFDGLTDTNGDGIPDIVKPILDLDLAGPVDQIIPGMTDLAAVDQGLDAASKSLTTTTGVIASVALQGEAQAVALVGAPAAGNQQTAYVATGSYGLAIVDATDAKNPIVLSQLKLPGTATDVAVDSDLHIAAVATGANGLQLVNVDDVGSPALIQTVNIDATHVLIVDGIAYANDGEKLDAIDLLSGTVLQSLELHGQSVTGLAREGSMLYTFDSQTSLLNTIDISSGQMVLRGSAAVPLVAGPNSSPLNGKLFVGDGIAYVSDGQAGYGTVDVSNPDQPRVLAAPRVNGILSNAIALNGSGLGVAVGRLGAVNVLELVDTSDSTIVNRLITKFTLPANPFEVAIGEGTAFVADGAAGLQVVNYESTDTKGVAPTIQVLSAPTSVDPTAAGVGLVEGQAVSFKVKVTDDVQVRNVELLATATDPNTGQTQAFVLKNSVSFPFDLSGVLPTIAALDGATQMTLQVAATDTGGNTTLSTPMVVTLVPDTTPPKLLQQSLAEGDNRTPTPGVVTFSFSKPLDPVTVNDSTFFLVGSDGSKIPVTVGLRDNGQTVELAYNQALAFGRYQLEVDAANIADRVGNALGSNILTTHFAVSQISDTWIGPQTGGLWSDAANWSAGRVPGASDDVRVDLGPGGSISVNNGDHTVAALALTGTLSVDAGSLTVLGQADIEGTLNVNAAAAFDANGTTTIGGLSLRGTLSGTGTVTLAGAATVLGGQMTGAGTTVVQGNLTIDGVGLGLSGGRVLETEGATHWANGSISGDGSALLDNRGTIFVSGSATATARLNNSGSIEIGDRASVEFDGGGTQSGSFSGNGSLAFVGGTLTFTSTSRVAVADLSFQDVDATLAGAITVGAGNQVNFDSSSTGSSSVSITGSITGAGDVSVQAAVSVGANATYGVTGGMTIDGGVLTFEGGATLRAVQILFGSTLDAEGDITIETLRMSESGTLFNVGGATLTGPGTVTITGATTLDGGNMTGPGTTIMQGGLTIAGEITIAGGRLLVNPALANWTAGNIVFGAGGGVFRNDAGAVFNANFGPPNPFAPGVGGSIFAFDATSVSLFDNRGTFNQIAGAPSAIGVSFTNSGAIVDDGVVALSGGGTSTGTITVNANASLLFNAGYTVAGGAVSGSGKIFVDNAKVELTGAGAPTVEVEAPAQYAFTGTTRVVGGILRFGGAVTLAGTTSIAAGATVSVAGNLTMQSTSVLDIELGSDGFGLLQVGGSAVLDGTLKAVPLAGFAPTVGQTFTFLTFARDAGAFATVTGTALGSTEALVLDTSDATDLRFDVVSTAATTALAKKPAVALLTTSASVSARTATPPPVHNKMRF